MNFSFSTTREPSDWLSPILVKELRQGMRGKLFLFSFLLLQGAMILCVSGQLLAAASPQASGFGFFSGLFWFIIGVALIGVIPLAGMGALRSEIQANSMELIFLTHLTPWRIVAGKWTALTAQALLFVCAVLPYIVLRYFLGGIDLIGELKILFWLLVTTLLLTGVTVSTSAYHAWVVRGAMIFFLFIFLFGGFQMLFFLAMGGMGSSMTGATAVNPYIVAAVFVPLAVLCLFESGAGKIAPPANRHNLRMRLLGLAFLLGASGLLVFANASEMVLILALIPVVAACVAGLTAPPVFLRSPYAPFIRKGPVGRAIGYLMLYPGWPSAVGYTTIVFTLFAILWGLGNMSGDFLTGLFFFYGGMIFAAAITWVFFPFNTRAAAWFTAIQAIMVLIAAIVLAVDSVTNVSYAALVSFLPTTALILYFGDLISRSGPDGHLAAVAITTIVSLTALGGVAIVRIFPKIRQQEELAILDRTGR